MIEISKKEMLEKYGINLEKGTYTIENTGTSYTINTLKDDTSGCILVGELKHGNKLIHSSVAYTELFLLIKQLLKKGDVFIEITKPEITPIKEEILKSNVVETTVIEPILQVEEKESLTNQKKSTLWKSYFPSLFKLILNLLKHLLYRK